MILPKSKYLFVLGIILLVGGAIILIFNHEGFALKVDKFAYFVLVLATLLYFMEIKNDEK